MLKSKPMILKIQLARGVKTTKIVATIHTRLSLQVMPMFTSFLWCLVNGTNKRREPLRTPFCLLCYLAIRLRCCLSACGNHYDLPNPEIGWICYPVVLFDIEHCHCNVSIAELQSNTIECVARTNLVTAKLTLGLTVLA